MWCNKGEMGIYIRREECAGVARPAAGRNMKARRRIEGGTTRRLQLFLGGGRRKEGKWEGKFQLTVPGYVPIAGLPLRGIYGSFPVLMDPIRRFRYPERPRCRAGKL